MNSKFFKIGDVVFELKSEWEIADSKMFCSFKTNPQKPDSVIEIVRKSPLEIKGKLIDSYSNKEIYEDSGEYFLYSFYPESQNKNICYACSHSENNSTVVYIDLNKLLYDSLIFDSFNFPEILIKNNNFLFHCSFIMVEGKAILFSGDSGVGKSTQADLWKRYRNAEIINGDRAILKVENGKLIACGTPYCGSSKISLNKSAEVAAIIFPEHAKINSLEKIKFSFEAIPLLLRQITFENNENTIKVLNFSEQIFNSIPLIRQPCIPDKSAVDIAEKELKAFGVL